VTQLNVEAGSAECGPLVKIRVRWDLRNAHKYCAAPGDTFRAGRGLLIDEVHINVKSDIPPVGFSINRDLALNCQWTSSPPRFT
jgi:hypothetical protein